MEIKVLGPGCPKCQQTANIVKEVVEELGINANIEKVTDVMKIASYGVFGTPAVIVDGNVKSVGKVPTKDNIKSWLKSTSDSTCDCQNNSSGCGCQSESSGCCC
ncbi:MAG: TM0996/MTH895 family glutaredoxin-like protein [Desulfobacterales bacterium]|nr:TM0996/MTH895 family glutaredoxin-like protein [Desulfobacterales bacterium]